MKEIQFITDNHALEPLNDFDKLSESIVLNIKNSEPQFTIGIYGEWGTGKTTLMRQIEDKLQEEQTVITIWFSAWRYAREEQLASIALMKTIAYKMYDCQLDSVSHIILQIAQGLATGIVNKFFFKPLTEKNINNIIQDIPYHAEWRTLLKYNTLYFDGIKKISDEMKKNKDKGRNYKIVVFVDDLDRCSPPKALEILESIKAFLDITGFIYIIGISYETTSQLIQHVYKDLHIDGKEYIKKIIQVPISLPLWKSELDRLLSNIIVNWNVVIPPDVRSIIFKTAGSNPRQLKRIINSFIVARNTYVENNQKLEIDILFTALLIRRYYPKFFSAYMHNTNFRKKIGDFFTAWNKMQIHYRHSVEQELAAESKHALYRLTKLIYDTPYRLPDPEMLRKAIFDAFREHLRADEPRPQNVTQTLRSSDFSESESAIFQLSLLLKNDELIKVPKYHWPELCQNVAKINEPLKSGLYLKALDLMREDLDLQLQ